MERTPQKRFLLSPSAEVKIYSPVPRVNRQRQRASAAPAKGSFLYTIDLSVPKPPHPVADRCFVAERQQGPSILQQENHPLAYRHLRKIDSAEGKAGKEHHSAFRQRAIGYSSQRFRRCFRAVRPSPGFASFRFGLCLSDVFRRERHRKETRIQPVLRSLQSSGFEQSLVERSGWKRSQQTEYRQSRRPGIHHSGCAFGYARRIAIHTE